MGTRGIAQPNAARVDVWVELETLLDRLDDPADPLPPGAHLAACGLRIFATSAMGSSSTRACAAAGLRRRLAPLTSTPGRAGSICQACGGGHNPHHHLVDAATRGRLSAAASGRDAALLPDDTAVARKLVDEALAGHAGLDE